MKRILVVLVLSAVSTRASAVGVPGQGTWETTLLPRAADNDGIVDAYYDTALNVTWLADANALIGTIYDLSATFGDREGLTIQCCSSGAEGWVASLSADNYLGVTGWRIPVVNDIDDGGCGDGDVIPIPAAVWLFGSALDLLGWLKRRTA